MKKRSGSLVQWFVGLSVLVGVVLAFAESAPAQQVARIAKYTLADPAKLPELFRLTNEINDLYANSFAFQGLKLFYDRKSGECVAVSVWESRSGLLATVQADEFKGLLDKVKPLTKGDFAVKTYEVYVPKRK